MSFYGEQVAKNGVRYCYTATTYWDPERKRTLQKRTYIGKKDPVTGEFIPNLTYYRLYGGNPADGTGAVKPPAEAETPEQPAPAEAGPVETGIYGPVYALRAAAGAAGLTEALKTAFPEHWEDILACTLFRCTERRPLFLYKPWAESAFGVRPLEEKELGELIRMLDLDAVSRCLLHLASLRGETEFLACAVPGPGGPLAVLAGKETGIPAFCAAWPGELQNLQSFAEALAPAGRAVRTKTCYLLGEEFWSDTDVRDLLGSYTRLTAAVPWDAAAETVSGAEEALQDPDGVIVRNGKVLCTASVTRVLDGRRVFFHIFRDRAARTAAENRTLARMTELEAAVESGRLPASSPEVQKLLDVDEKNGRYQFRRKRSAAEEAGARAGTLVLMSSMDRDPVQALDTYAVKGRTERLVSLDPAAEGAERLGVSGAELQSALLLLDAGALAVRTAVQKKLLDGGLKLTFDEAACELAKLTVIQEPGRPFRLSTVTEMQQRIFTALGTDVPGRA